MSDITFAVGSVISGKIAADFQIERLQYMQFGYSWGLVVFAFLAITVVASFFGGLGFQNACQQFKTYKKKWNGKNFKDIFIR